MFDMTSGKIEITVEEGAVTRVELVEYNNRRQPDRPTSILPLVEGKEYIVRRRENDEKKE